MKNSLMRQQQHLEHPRVRFRAFIDRATTWDSFVPDEHLTADFRKHEKLPQSGASDSNCLLDESKFMSRKAGIGLVKEKGKSGIKS